MPPRRARIDLHGMTLAQAHTAVQEFLQKQFNAGARHLEIVTGKGHAASTTTLRREVPLWLELPPWRARISSVANAPEKEGGAGALRVVFRSQKREAKNQK